MYSKLFAGAVVVVALALAAVAGDVVLRIGPGRGESSGTRESRSPSTVAVDHRAGDAAVEHCDLMPEHYEPQDEDVAMVAPVSEAVNAWAAGNTAVARYLNELARQCVTVQGAR
jgi:hypothetical protein